MNEVDRVVTTVVQAALGGVHDTTSRVEHDEQRVVGFTLPDTPGVRT